MKLEENIEETATRICDAMAGGFADTTATGQLKIIQGEADDAGDKLVRGRVARPSTGERNLLTLARILTNSNYRAAETNSLRAS